MTSRLELEALVAIDIRDPIPSSTLTPTLNSPPFIQSNSIYNLRDAGAVPGSRLPIGLIYRSAALAPAAHDPEAIAWLSAHVERVFDLRTEEEREKNPDPAAVPGVENVWFPEAFEYRPPGLDEYVDGGGEKALKMMYMDIVRLYKPIFRAVLEHVRDRPGSPFLFHCAFGRDRTGIVSALLQNLAGTSQDVVILDYMLTRIASEPAREKLTAQAMQISGAQDWNTPGFKNMVSLRPSCWREFVKGLEDEYDSWDGYVIKGLGFSMDELELMKKNLRS